MFFADEVVWLLVCVPLTLSVGAETSQAPSIIDDEVVCFLSLLMEEFGCWDGNLC